MKTRKLPPRAALPTLLTLLIFVSLPPVASVGASPFSRMGSPAVLLSLPPGPFPASSVFGKGKRFDRASGARNGSIRGRVELLSPATPIERRPSVTELGRPAPRGFPDLLRSVVYLESAPRGAFEANEGGHAVMDQRNETFVPHVLAISTGTTVEFPNSDRFYHNVFSLSKTRRFDLGRYSAGHSQSVRFDRPGIVRVFCEIHSHMNAFILVFSHPFFVVTDGDGRYRIDNVPPGSYNVVAWNEGTVSDPKPVAIPDGGTSELDFALR
jgi:plastocyanin